MQGIISAQEFLRQECGSTSETLALKIIWPSRELFLGKEVIKKNNKPKQELTGEVYFHIGQKEFER